MTRHYPSPDQLEHEAQEHLRRAVAAAEAIRDRVSGLNFAEDALAATKEAGGTFAVNLGRAVRDNPVPAALLGVGIVWLAAAGRRPRDGDGAAGDEAIPLGYEAAPAPAYGADEVVDIPPRSVGAAAVRDQAAQFADAAAERAHRAREAAEELGEEAGGRVRRGARRVASAAGRTASGALEYGKEHPLTLALGALAIGAAVAALLPRTRRENRVMGEAAEGTRRYAHDRAEEAAERARRGVRRAAGIARDTAEHEAAHVADSVGEAGDAATEALREEIEGAAEEIKKP